jgi:hypothetical protein
VTPAEVSNGVRAHLDAFFAGREHEEFWWNLGPIRETLPRFRVRRIDPASRQDTWIYATVGAWEAAPDDPLELYLEAPEEDPRHVELLSMVAFLHAEPRYRLHVGKVLEIGRPWMDRSRADHLLVSLPYPHGPALERCEVADRLIRVLWLLPITADEAAFAREHGHERLEERLEAAAVDWIKRRRRSVV